MHMKRIGSLAVCLALLIGANVAYAAGTTGDGKASLKQIYSTFNPDRQQKYDCCGGVYIATRDSPDGFRQYIGIPFIPVESVRVRRIKVAMSHMSGSQTVAISLRADAAGLPGEVIQHFQLTALQDFGQCCDTVSMSTKGIDLVAGTRYWVVARATGETSAAWNNNTIGARGDLAVNEGRGWIVLPDSELTAFAVLGE
jgi:hypothetical protein